MLYAIMATDVPESASRRAKTRPRHMEYIKPLIDGGQLILAGPHPKIDSSEPSPAGMTGSLIVAEFASLDAAQQWADNDPYLLEGVFEQVSVKPLIKVYP